MIDYLKLAEQATDPQVKLMLLEEWAKQQQITPSPEAALSPDPEEQLRKEISRCEKCLYRKTCRRPVPWEGKLTSAKLLLIGEAPGLEEDRLGKPFVGRSGQLLRTVMAQALKTVGLTEEDVVITNTVLCRPPHNETPTPDARMACNDYLISQLELCPATVIITLGATALQWFRPFDRITQVHGVPFWWPSDSDPGKFGRWIWPMYHPSAALRDPQRATEFIQDWDAFAHDMVNWPWEQHQLDPRPDLPKHEFWVDLLRRAYPRPTVWGVFHGLRCLGCDIVLRGYVENPEDICDQVEDVCVVRPPDCPYTATEIHEMIRAALEHRPLPVNLLTKEVAATC